MQSTVRGGPLAFRTIVVATDFSVFADRALLKTVELAHRSKARIILAHVIDPLIYCNALNGAPFVLHRIEQDVREGLENSAEVLRRERIPYELVVREGIVRDCLCQLVEDLDADLLVIGTHGESRFDREVVCSVAEKILRVAPCLVMTVGPLSCPSVPGETTSKRLLFATGFSAHSVSALPFVDALAHHLGSELYLLHVGTLSADKDVARNSMEKLEQMARMHIRLTPRVHCVVQNGGLGDTIAAVVSSIGAVATVLAVQQEDLRRKPVGGLNQGLIYRIVTQMCCPVFTLHSGLEKGCPRTQVMDEALLSQ